MVAGCGLLGWLVLAALRQRPSDGLATAVLSSLLGVSIVGWVGVLLAELGLFSLGSIIGIWGVLVAGFAIFAWRQSTPWTISKTQDTPEPWLAFVPNWVEYAVLAVWLITATWLFLRPHEFVFGAADAGVYVNLGAAIAQEGQIVQQDPFLATLDPALYPAFLRPTPTDPVAPYYLFPAFYVLGQPPGEITPQFYPGHPVWLAIAYSLSGEQLATTLMLPGVWAILAGLVVYVLSRQLGGWQTAVLILAGLTFNALQIWFARYPTAESLSQFLLWGGLWAIGIWVIAPKTQPLWGLAAGLALGQFFLVRIDAIIILPVFALLAGWQLLQLKNGLTLRQLVWFWLPFVAAILHAFAHGLWQSQPYFWSIFGILQQNIVRYWVPLLIAAAGIGAVAWFLMQRQQVRIPLIWQRRLGGLLVVALLAWGAYGWFVRPYVNETLTWINPYDNNPTPIMHHENWLRLGWYLTPIGVWLGILGSVWLVWRAQKKTVVFLGVGLIFALVYLTNTRANPHQIYVMRRYVPAVLPLFVIGAGYLLYQVAQWKRPFSLLLAGLLTAVWLAGFGWSARGFISQIDYAGATAQLEVLNSQLVPNSIVLFNEQAPISAGDWVGTSLRFVYGHDVLILRDPTAVSDEALLELVQEWRTNGRSVYWFGNPTWLDTQGIAYTTSMAAIQTQQLEASYERKPTELSLLNFHLEIAQLK